MFVLYAIPIGLIAGWLLGGTLDGLAAVRFRFALVALVALVVQVLLFSPLLAGVSDDVGRIVYVLSTLGVVIVVAANVRLTGMPIVLLGAALNLAAIVANGGAMPADPQALASVGIVLDGPSNSVVVSEPILRPLTDIFALPSFVPLANVFSVGDVLIGVGVAVAIAAAMRTRRRARPAT